jgi:hypothetical protein
MKRLKRPGRGPGSRAPLVPYRPTSTRGRAHARHSRHAPLLLVRGSRIAQAEVDVTNRSARLPVTARVGPLARPQPPGTTAAVTSGRTASAAATRARAAGRELQLCATVLIAAILRPVIRADRTTLVGACRDWPKPKEPDDRRGAERQPEGNRSHRAKGTNRKRTVPALDPGGGSRCRSPAGPSTQRRGPAVATPARLYGIWRGMR